MSTIPTELSQKQFKKQVLPQPPILLVVHPQAFAWLQSMTKNLCYLRTGCMELCVCWAEIVC